MLTSFPILKRWLGRTVPPPRYPPLDDDETLYVVGDIHGRLDCLRDAHHAIDSDREGLPAARRHTEVYLGDYVDRGPDSKGVIERLLARQRCARTVFLAGNHDLMMRDFLSGALSFDAWLPFGGAATLNSYGVEHGTLWEVRTGAAIRALIPPSHLSFLNRLRRLHVQGDYCFVHAGLRPGYTIDQQSLRDLTEIRSEFLSYRGSFEHVVVHAHTPVEAVDFRSNRINLDTGAYRSGRLAVLKLDANGPRLVDP